MGILRPHTIPDGLQRKGDSGRLYERRLGEAGGFQVLLTGWSPEAHPWSAEASTEYAVIEFMQQGTYRKSANGRTTIGDPNTVVFFNPGEQFRVSHPTGLANCGFTVRLLPPTIDELLRNSGLGERKRSLLFEEGRAATPPGLHLRTQNLLTDLLCSVLNDPLEMAERVFAIVDQTLPLARDAADKSDPCRRVQYSARESELAATLIEFLNTNYGTRSSLDEIGAAAGVSGWHAARVFRRCTGTSMHKYLVRLRLRHVLAELADGCGDLTQLALRTGFHSHSHMAAAFKREFRSTPSSARAPRTRRLGGHGQSLFRLHDDLSWAPGSGKQ